MRIFEPENAFWKGAKKHGVKKVVESKNVFYKSCQKFHILGGNFFLFDKISKMGILEPKNAFWNNNDFILKILNSTPFGQKIRQHFWPKKH